MTDTFFDLQRFAVLVGGQSSFIWQDGELFGAGASAAVGTSSNPAYLVAKDGVAEAGTGTDVYLSGEKSYSFSLDGKDGWSAKLGKDNVAHVTNGASGIALAGLTGSDAAVLTITGEFAEDIGADVTTTAETKASLAADGTLTFGKAVEGAAINLGAGEIAVLNKGGNDVVLNNGAFNGIDITKKATLTSSDGTVAQIVTGNNSITMSNGNIVDIKADKDTNATIGSDQVISGVTKGATITAAQNNGYVTVNDHYWEFSGGVSSIAFDSLGSAKIENTGAVVVTGQAGAVAAIQNLDTAGATVNGVKVAMTELNEAESANVGFALENGGVSSVDVSKALGTNLVASGDQLFVVKAGNAEHIVSTDASSVTFNATGSQINLAVEKEKSYAAAGGGNAQFLFAENATNVSLNNTTVQLGTAEGVTATASDATAGIENLNGLDVGSKVSVAGDSDGFTAAFDAVEGNDAVVFEVNNASIRAAGIEGQQVQISVNGAGTEALVTGMNTTDQVSVGGTGIIYHFKDATSDNAVTASAGEGMYVTLDSTGGIADAMDDANYKKLKENDQAKWDNVASIGNDQYVPTVTGDTVPANRSDVYNQFYNLNTSDAGQSTLAVFSNEDSTTFDTVANPNGITFTGRDNTKTLAENGHVTLTAGAAVGAAPINIQRNESAAVVDVVVDLRNATLPSTVAVGTLEDTVNGNVTASHAIFLSNAGPGYVEIGNYATGQNQIFAGTGGAQIRHDGQRATIVGNTGIDTIWAGKYDIVAGGTGGDRFYDSADYTITDYNAAEGDALIATRLHGIEEINKNNIKYNYDAGNEVSFGESRNSFTIGQDQNAALNLNVAIMDTDARIIDSRSVVLAGANGGAADASSLTSGALIIADESRNGNAGDAVVGSAYADEIYIGANDAVNAGEGNDYITIGSISSTSGDAGATVFMGAGKNTVSGWSFGFDKNAGNTQLIAAEGFVGSFDNDRLLVTDANGSMLFDDSAKTSYHGEYDVIVNDTKYMAIRTNDVNNTNPVSYGDVTSNDDLADIYIAEREGVLLFGSGVTENLGLVDLTSTKYQNISSVVLANNSKAVVLGSDQRETVALGGDAAAGANKYVDLGAGNDVIISGGDDSLNAGHALFFGVGDGRDTIRGFSHYLGVDADPDKEYADILVLDNYEGLYTGTGEDGGARIEFVTGGDDSRVFLYEDAGISTDNIYQVRVNLETKLTKIGNSNGSNVFTYSDKVDYYVGSSAENAADTLVVGNDVANVNIWLDGSKGDEADFRDEYYRGIAVVDAGAETNTNVMIAGNSRNNTLIAGGAGTYNALWGGTGDNELIGSTAGEDTFFYVRNAGAYLHGDDEDITAVGGNDQVYNYEIDNNDLVWLGDTKLSDITKTTIEDNAVTIEFNTGGSLTVNGTSDVRFAVDGGTASYVANKESKTWTQE